MDFKKDIGFNDRLVTYLYALEAQDLIEMGQEDELQDVQEAYGIPDEEAPGIIEGAARRYLSQLFNFALRSAKRYDEKESVKWLREILKYTQFITVPIDCDANLFLPKDKDRLLGYLANNLESLQQSDETSLEKLNEIIKLSDDYVSPLSGIEGLMGGIKNLNELMVADASENKKRCKSDIYPRQHDHDLMSVFAGAWG